MVAEQTIVSLAMAAQEEVDELREEVARLRSQFETITAAEQGRLAKLDEDLRAEVRDAFEKLPDREEFYAHLNAIQEKLEEDQGAVQGQLALLRDVARESATASSVTVFPRKPSRPLRRLGRSYTSPSGRGSRASPPTAGVPSGRTGGALPWTGSARTRTSRASLRRLRG